MKFFSPFALLVAALVSLATAAFLVSGATPSSSQFFLEVRLASTNAGRAQLFYDRGAGLSEADSSQTSIVRSTVPLLYRLSLPPGTYKALRFDPNDRDGTVILADPPRIIAPGGRVARVLQYPELQPTGQIQSALVRDGQCEIVIVPGGVDPQLFVDLTPPLDLRPSWLDLRTGFFVRACGTFFALALLLFVLDRAPPTPALTTWQRFRHFAAQPPLWLTLATCAAVLAARRPEGFSNPQFWGEDSIIFFQAAHVRGATAILEPYASYLHAIPRLSAAAAMAFDPRWAPALFAAVAFVGTLYVAARTQSARCPLPRHAGCALAVVLVPDAYEVLLNVDNLQWFIAGALVLLLISADATRWWHVVHDGLVAVLFGLTGPFSILLCGLFILRAWTRRTRASIALAALIATCAAIQVWTIWHNPVATSVDRIASEALLAVPGMRVTASLLAGWLVPADFPRAVETALGVVALAGLAALGTRRGPHRAERLWMALAAVALLAGSLYRCRYVLVPLCHATFGSRYFYPIVMIVLWLLLAAATDSRRWLARTATALVVWSLLINLPRLRETAFPDLHWSYFAQKIGAGLAVDVPVNPEPWVMSLPATTQTALVESNDQINDTPRLIHLSSRVLVRTGAQVAVSGLVVSGSLPKKILIRAIGPALAQFGVTTPLSHPKLTLVNLTGTALATNAGWENTSVEDVTAVRNATTAAGTFAFPAQSRDAALLLTLPPGNYTAQVSSATNTPGVALVEIYEVP
jgi:hypothetical protein